MDLKNTLQNIDKYDIHLDGDIEENEDYKV